MYLPMLDKLLSRADYSRVYLLPSSDRLTSDYSAGL